MHESLVGTFETCRRTLKMSAYRTKPEVIGARSERRQSGRRCCARLSGKRILCGRYCPERQLLAGRKSDAILWGKPPCQTIERRRKTMRSLLLAALGITAF